MRSFEFACVKKFEKGWLKGEREKVRMVVVFFFFLSFLFFKYSTESVSFEFWLVFIFFKCRCEEKMLVFPEVASREEDDLVKDHSVI